MQQTGYQLRRGQAGFDGANPALTRHALLAIDCDRPTALHWPGVTPKPETVPATVDPAQQRPDPSAPMSFAQAKAIANRTYDLQGRPVVSAAARARASFRAGGSAVAEALSRP